MPKKVVIGTTYNHLTIIEFLGGRYYVCRCVCGKLKKIRTDHFRNGKTTSCGCVGQANSRKASTKHRHSYNRLYFVWYSMMDRCYNENFQDYRNYGGRGIAVCERWKNVSNFIEDMTDGADKSLQLDRIDNDGPYSKENCRWVTRKQNNRNKRTNLFITVGDRKLTVSEWSEVSGVRRSTIMSRYNRGIRGSELIKLVE